MNGKLSHSILQAWLDSPLYRRFPSSHSFGSMYSLVASTLGLEASLLLCARHCSASWADNCPWTAFYCVDLSPVLLLHVGSLALNVAVLDQDTAPTPSASFRLLPQPRVHLLSLALKIVVHMAWPHLKSPVDLTWFGCAGHLCVLATVIGVGRQQPRQCPGPALQI
jgi:hypothetical protein